jgi:hypothetical protein
MTPFSLVYLKEKGVIRGHKEDRKPYGQKREGSSEAIKRRTDNPMEKRERGHQSHKPSSLYGV